MTNILDKLKEGLLELTPQGASGGATPKRSYLIYGVIAVIVLIGVLVVLNNTGLLRRMSDAFFAGT